MAKSKSISPEAFLLVSERVAEAAVVLKAMASDTRLMILCALNENEMSVTRLAELTNQSSSAVSQHLSKLRAAGLVESRRDAQTIYYRCSGGIGNAVVKTLCNFYR
ncbi:ArsR/SmtB family transcription factor [Hyphomonas sp.]|uniref:ArsR/SmtB family transcription factor n=1 Tax=Hyphomonas sp. TaxID=87 RepID=UPI003567CC5D